MTGILEALAGEVGGHGGAEAARAIEPLCMLWCIPGFLRNEDGAFAAENLGRPVPASLISRPMDKLAHLLLRP